MQELLLQASEDWPISNHSKLKPDLSDYILNRQLVVSAHGFQDTS